jgi:pyroglutamyl-peptidase
MRVLISGFEPFGGREVNPTALLVDALKNREIEIPKELILDQILLPVTFEKSFEVLQDKINSFNPDIVIAFGLAAKRAHIELENVAVNKIHADIKDNDGVDPQNRRINESGVETYFSTLPIQGITAALQSAGLSAKISNDAGNFVCNYLFYRMMETNQDTLRLCGFIHVPLLPEHAGEDEASLSYSDLLKAVSVILEYIKY